MATQAGSVFVTVGAKISDFDTGMKRVQDRMTRFQRDARSATSSAGSFRTGVGKLGAALTALAYGGMSAVGRGLQAMATGIRIARAAFGALIGATVGGVGLAYAFKYAITQASNLNEEMNKTRVVFGKAAGGMIRWSKTAGTNLGMAQATALQAAGNFGALFTQMGQAPKKAGQMSRALVGLASDFASFYNTSPEQALEAIRAGLAGETEPLRRYGIFLNEARIRQEAISSGFVPPDFKGTLDPTIRTLAAYNYIIKNSTKAQGDFAATAGGFANQMRILRAGVINLASAFGQGLIPAATGASRSLNKMLADPATIQRVRELGVLVGQKLRAAFDAIRTWMQENWGGIKEGFATTRDILVGAASAARTLAKMLGKIAEITPGSGVTDLLAMLAALLGTKSLIKNAPKIAKNLLTRTVAGGGGKAAGAAGSKLLGGGSKGLLKTVAKGGLLTQVGLELAFPEAAGAGELPIRGSNGVWYNQRGVPLVPSAQRYWEKQYQANMRAGSSGGIGKRPEEGTRGPRAGAAARKQASAAKRRKIGSNALVRRPPVAAAVGTAAAARATARSMTDQPLVPFGFQEAVARAELTKKISDDLKAYSQLEAYLVKRVAAEKNVERRIDLLQALKDTREKKAGLLKPAEKADAASIVGQLFGGGWLGGEQFQYAAQFGYKATGQDLLKDLRGQVQTAKAFEGNLALLRKRGAPEAMIQELQAQGVGASENVAALTRSFANKQYAQKYATLYGQRQEVANASVAGDQINIGPFYVNSKSEEEGVRRAMRRAKFALAGAGAGRKGGR